jgi:GNAT superfamily N-acetyltransferase
VTLRIEVGPDEAREDVVTAGLVAHNQAASDMIRLRFQPENLRSQPLAAYALDDDGTVVGGCVASMVPIWHWLEIDTMWVDPGHRGSGLARRLLERVEDQARAAGCRWAKLNTWEFQAPGFYAACGYVEHGREVDYPPGHTNVLMRKDL